MISGPGNGVEQLIFRRIEFGGPDYAREFELRHQVLRVPLGLSLHDEDLSGEKDQSHFGLFDSAGALVACVIAVRVSPSKARIRQMAVQAGEQGRGHGRRIMGEVERLLEAEGIHEFFMHARMSAHGFYARLGYVSAGDVFSEVGIPHVRMEKTLPLAAY